MPQPRNTTSSPEPLTDSPAEAVTQPPVKRARAKRASTTAKSTGAAAAKPRATRAKATTAKTAPAKASPAKAATPEAGTAQTTSQASEADGTSAKAPRAKAVGSATAKPRATRAKATTTAAKPRAARAKATTRRTATQSAAEAASADVPIAEPAEPATSQGGAAQRGGDTPSGAGEPRVESTVNGDAMELIAERLRKLNERIIELGREAGEARLASYEKTLKTIANSIAQGPGKEELGWIAQLASSQAKFVREITDSWAKAARDRFK